MPERDIKRGQVWYANLDGSMGSEQSGLRPCVIVQNDIGNKYSSTTIIIPVTTHFKKFNATHVDVTLLRPSKILCEQPRTVDKRRLKEYICTLDDCCMSDIDAKLKLSLGLI